MFVLHNTGAGTLYVFCPYNYLFMGMANRIEEWAKLIEKHEGFYKGSRSYRNNNSGNLRYTSYSASLGENKGKDSGNFVIYKTYEIGFNALKQFLIDACMNRLRAYDSEMTLLQFYQRYAPSSDGNSPKNYATFIAKGLGASINTKIGTLIDDVPEPKPADVTPYMKILENEPQRFNCVLFARRYVPKLPYGLWTLGDKRKIINASKPKVGSVAVINAGPWGHVAVVTTVWGNGMVTIKEANYKTGRITERRDIPVKLKIEGYYQPK